MAAIADCYRRFREWDRIHAPSAEARKELAKIEAGARALLEALQASGGRARDALDRQVSTTIVSEMGEQIMRALADDTASPSIAELAKNSRDMEAARTLHEGGELSDYNIPGRAVRQELVRLMTMTIAAAKSARAGIPRSGGRNNAARLAAVQLRASFVRHGLAFSASADEFGHTSDAVIALVKIARMAGHAMTTDDARKWVERANGETLQQVMTHGFPSR
jgi:hypothetical protein